MAEKIDVEEINAHPNVIPDGNDERAVNEQAQLLSSKERTLNAELGYIGKLFGGRQEKPGNISGIVIILSLIILIILLFTKEDALLGYEKSDVLTAVLGIITTTLGYLFGSNTKD